MVGLLPPLVFLVRQDLGQPCQHQYPEELHSERYHELPPLVGHSDYGWLKQQFKLYLICQLHADFLKDTFSQILLGPRVQLANRQLQRDNHEGSQHSTEPEECIHAVGSNSDPKPGLRHEPRNTEQEVAALDNPELHDDILPVPVVADELLVFRREWVLQHPGLGVGI